MDTILNVVLAVSAVLGVSIAFLEYRGKNAERTRANAERTRANAESQRAEEAERELREQVERELREEEEKLRELAAYHRGRATTDEREAANVDKARAAIESGAEDRCPTCRRGFESANQAEISDNLRRQATAIRRRAARETEEAEKLSASADETAVKLARVNSL